MESHVHTGITHLVMALLSPIQRAMAFEIVRRKTQITRAAAVYTPAPRAPLEEVCVFLRRRSVSQPIAGGLCHSIDYEKNIQTMPASNPKQ